MNRYNMEMSRWEMQEKQEKDEEDKYRKKQENSPNRSIGVTSVGYNLLNF